MHSVGVVLLATSMAFSFQEQKKRRDPKPDPHFGEVVQALLSGNAETDNGSVAKRIIGAFDARFPTPKSGHLVYRDAVVWFVETPTPGPVHVNFPDGRRFALQPLGETKVWAGAKRIDGHVLETRYEFDLDGKRSGGGQVRIEYFPLGPDSLPKPDVPKGKLQAMPPWRSKLYPGTERDWWVYIPSQYDAKAGACLMVFQDGRSYATGEGNVCTVFDNLIHAKKIPPIVGVFVNPGRDIGGGERPIRRPEVSRSEEYDTCTPKFAEYLEKEILPEVQRIVAIKQDPASRAICGISSGGSCAFTAAWHRPDLFGRVLSHVGSFCDFRQLESFPKLDGSNPPRLDNYKTWQVAHNYPALIRKTPPKALRVFLQDGSRDLDNSHGSWPLANQQMAAALRFAGYKYKFDYANGFHSLAHGKAIMPESLIWLWSNE